MGATAVRIEIVGCSTTYAQIFTDSASDWCAPDGQAWHNPVDYSRSARRTFFLQVKLQRFEGVGPWSTRVELVVLRS